MSRLSSDLAARLDDFFSQWRKLEATPAPSPSARVTDRAIRTRQLADFFRQLASALSAQAAHRRRGDGINVWEIGGPGRDELRNSRVLAWLLDQHGSHGQRADLAASLLDLVGRRIGDLSGRQITASRYRVAVESCPLGDKDSRVDIEIEGDGALLFIEVKIDAPETASQLDRYIDIAAAKSSGRPWGLVYLTPDGRLPDRYIGSGSNDRLMPLRWRELAEIVERQARSLPDCFARAVLFQYAAHIRTF